LRDKKIEIKIQGNNIQSVDIDIRKLVSESLEVLIPVGTYFVCSAQSAQNMVATEERVVDLTGNDWMELLIDAACANRPKDIPDSGNTFTVQRLPQQDELARLMPVLEEAGVGYAVLQAAVWIVTDDASYSDLGTLVSRPQFSTFGGTRVIGEAETARAIKICAEAGIEITRKRIWEDRQTIIQGLPDGELKTWLIENK